MFQPIIVILIIASAVGFFVWRIVKKWKGKDGCDGNCQGCGNGNCHDRRSWQ